MKKNKCIIYIANTSWYLFNFRLALMRRMVLEGWKVLGVAPFDKYSSRLQDYGICYRDMPMPRRGENFLSDLRAFLCLYKIYLTEKPSIVHHFTAKPVIYGSLAARLANVSAIVNSITGLGYCFVDDGWKRKLLRIAVQSAYRMALKDRNSRVIFQNLDDKDFFSSSGLVSLSRAVLIRGSGVDTDKFTFLSEPQGEPVILLCSRMLWDKGVGDLIEAVKILRTQGLPGRVLLVGDTDLGNPASIAKPQLLEWQHSGLIEWLGHREDVPRLVAQSHVAVLPSYREGLPRILTEAAAGGRPIVATDIAGCREIVRHGENGFLVPPRNPQALATAIAQLLRDPKLRRRMGLRGREIAISEFSEELVVRKTLAVYEGLLEQQAARFSPRGHSPQGRVHP